MEIKIFDVEHGNCTLIKAPNGRHIMIDCGHNDTTQFRPSSYLQSNNIYLDFLIISNVDQDHISDLPDIYKKCTPNVLTRNPHVDRNFLYNNKEEITEAMLHYIEIHEKYNSPVLSNDFGGLQMFYFNHDPSKFNDTNNLSLVTFIQYNGLNIIFPGDLETAGWLEFLKNKDFISHLQKTNIFLASHHGRESGYCKDIFNICYPEVILISDENVKYDTQKDIGYAQHARGVNFNGNTKKVLTTRNNGMISLWTDLVNGNSITYQFN